MLGFKGGWDNNVFGGVFLVISDVLETGCFPQVTPFLFCAGLLCFVCLPL